MDDPEMRGPADPADVADDERRLREINDLFGRAVEHGEIDEYLAQLHPEVRFVPVTMAAEGRVGHGIDEARTYLAGVREAFDRMDIRIEHVERLGHGLFLVHQRWRARGRGSGATLESPLYQVVGIRDGRGALLRAFTDEAAARTAAQEELSAARSSSNPG